MTIRLKCICVAIKTLISRSFDKTSEIKLQFVNHIDTSSWYVQIRHSSLLIKLIVF